jgi:hypothetical protein
MGFMVLVDAVLVLGVVALVVYGSIRVLTRARYRLPAASHPGVWRATHYDVKGVTKVVLQKMSPQGAHLINEHVVASIRLDDPEYDTLFMTAMATARERRALFESEED